MKSPYNISACYFPSTVIFIDDNRKFLENINLQLNTSTATYQYFDNPLDAVNFLNQYKSDPFTNRCLLQKEVDDFDHRAINIEIGKICREVYNINRYSQISVIVVDYAMPAMTGAEFIKKLKEYDFKIILLTGEANYTNAVQLFNDGIIDYFIRKDEVNVITLLKKAISRLQHEYMTELSRVVINSIVQKTALFGQTPSCLNDPTFIQFFDTFIDKNNITEYYLYDEIGSFLLIDENDKLSWLIVLNEEEMEITENEMSGGEVKISPTLLKAIKERQVLRYCFDPAQHPTLDEINAGETLFYPATKLSGHNTYYYSHITKPLTKPLIDMKKIIFYDMYKKV